MQEKIQMGMQKIKWNDKLHSIALCDEISPMRSFAVIFLFFIV
jgi:hypothetical protein